MSARDIATMLGGARRSGCWWRCRCPVHGSRGPTLALRDGDHGLTVKCFADCDPRDVLAELRRRGLVEGGKFGHSGPAKRYPHSRPLRDRVERRIAIARQIWEAARVTRGTPVERYFAGRRIKIPLPSSLRWEPRCWHRDARAELPAMISAVLDVEGRLAGVHRTYLTRDDCGQWSRRNRASLGPIGGGAVRLAPAAETLMVGEGIETCMAAMQPTSQPAWAALSTSGLMSLVLPAIAQRIIILADHDANGAGERAAYAAADRWLGEGRRVRIAIPPDPGSDFADVLLGPSYA